MKAKQTDTRISSYLKKACNIPSWAGAMDREYNSMVEIKTWSYVKITPDMKQFVYFWLNQRPKVTLSEPPTWGAFVCNAYLFGHITDDLIILMEQPKNCSRIPAMTGYVYQLHKSIYDLRQVGQIVSYTKGLSHWESVNQHKIIAFNFKKRKIVSSILSS